jgi:leucyl/phenylalanyl-tRNA--protein transferase
MPVYLLTDELIFPAPYLADEDGLLAVGGDLSAERLLLAYRNGIFPWFNDDELIQWWSPDPRFVLFPGEIKISKSMKQLLKRNEFEFTTDKAFEEVITNCQLIKRNSQPGTWITDDMKAAYIKLYQLGYAHSAEVWKEGELVGGLYGIRLGKGFFGESMFSKESNASKYAFIKYLQQLELEGVELIDCQVYTEHLESLGARMIERYDFLLLLDKLLNSNLRKEAK